MDREPMNQNQKFALLVFGLVLLVAVVVIYMQVRGDIAAMTPTSAADTRNPTTVSGSGIMQSAPFVLGGGDYSVTWSASETDDDTPTVGCYHSATLRSAGGGTTSERLGSGDVSGEGTGTTTLYGIGTGRYYVDAASGCDWSITFTPS